MLRIAASCLCVLLTACGIAPQRPVSYLPMPVNASMDANATAQDVTINALGLIGTPYRYGGSSPDKGFDCSGLIHYVYRGAAGVKLPRTAAQMSQMQVPSVTEDELAAGDLVFFDITRQASHAGIYVGEGRFVHAPSKGGYVRMDKLNSDYWRRHYSGAKRVIQ
jgi:cell wall-associated NlpC family hydrolase